MMLTPTLAFPAARRLLALVFSGALACTALPALASPPPWVGAPYSYYAENTPLPTVLQEFASSFSLSLQMTPEVQGVVNGRFNAQTPTEFIDRLGSVYGLHWFTHAGTLFVSRTTEMSTRSITSGGSSIATVRQALNSLGVLDARFGWGELPEQGVALVSGPPAYVSLIERTMAALPLTAGGQQVAVFRLKHASVDDRTILYRDRQITTPGLARVLRSLIINNGTGGSTGVNNAPITSVAQMLNTMDSATPAANVAGLSFDANSNGQSTPNAASPNGTATGTGATPATSSAQTARRQGDNLPTSRRLAPSIQADSRLNAIIVQDTPERIPLYKTLIEQLDVASPLIEIEAMILDINSAKIDELGISWSGRRGGAVGGFGSMTPSRDGNDLVLGALRSSASVNPSTLVVSSGNYLMSRIRALEQRNEATVQSRPSILTIDNVGALLDLSHTFYIRTTGERVATVTPITAGTTLRVTPHYIVRDDGPVIQLDVDIEDGQVLPDTTVDSIPTVSRSVVSTQAIVGEGQTLLIGGYKSTQKSNEGNRVPGLGSVPVFGLLFSNKTVNDTSRERLFMIRPRLVTLPTQTANAVEALQPQRTQVLQEIPRPASDPTDLSPQ
jgi:type III secretion protein C